MFFPATSEAKIELDPTDVDMRQQSKQYLEKPTVIMSNPNALVY